MTTQKILIVNDEIIIARGLEARLTGFGYEVAGIAASGREAIALTAQTEPNLVLMDIVLKGDMDGIEAAEEIRRRWTIPIIFLTAYTDEATLRRAKVTGPFELCRKAVHRAGTSNQHRNGSFQGQDEKTSPRTRRALFRRLN